MNATLKMASAGRLFTLAVIILLFTGALSYHTNYRLLRSFGWVTESHDVLQTLQYIQTLQEYAEAGTRAYVITGDTRRLEPYRVGKTIIEFKLEELAPRFAAHPEEKQSFETLRALMTKQMTYLGRIIAERRDEGFGAAAATVFVEDEASHRFQMERLLSELEQQERLLLDQRWDQSVDGAIRAKIVIVLGMFISLLLMLGAYVIVRREKRERHAAERDMVRMQAFLHSVIENIPYLITVKEAQNMRLTLVNKAAEEWMNRSREQLLGSNAYDLFERRTADAAIESERRILKDGHRVDITEENVSPAGEAEKIAHTQKIPIVDENGIGQFLLCISEDITERKKGERLLKEAHDAAQEAARMKSEFIANMSHEIRTPIAIMTGMTALLLDTALTPDQKKFTQAVHRAGQNLSAIAKTLLDFSKIQTGTFALEVSSVDVRSIAQSLIEMHKEQAQGKGVSLAQLVDAEVPATLQGDAARLRQIMTQVLGNAVKFTQRGEIIVRVAVSRQSESQMWLHFSVSDTGIGIAPDIQKHVFEAFRQGDGSQTRRFGGTGMGLAIAKHTVELMGGEIGLESEPGKGSTFWWTVPLMKTSAESPRIQMATLPWVSARVLIVDDNVAQREIIRRHLSSWSLASEAASSGESGLDMIRREARAGRGFQICIVDLHLRDMDAMQFTQMLKKEPAFAEIRLIAMTTDEIPDPSVLRAFGFAQCIRKPVQPFELHNGLLAVVEAGQNRAA